MREWIKSLYRQVKLGITKEDGFKYVMDRSLKLEHYLHVVGESSRIEFESSRVLSESNRSLLE